LLPQKDFKHNVYARTLQGKEVHVSEVESGRKGYYCLGCGKALQAVKSEKERIDYFRHDVQDVNIERKCTYSDETHRHKLAKNILLHNKFIKVPSLYKYPPKDIKSLPNFISDSRTIEAHKVKLEVTFYENEFGEIKWTPDTNIDERYLVVRPDVVFFDKDDKPILFIELVATHKVSDEKRLKFKRLGIDAVEVKIPRDSPESIENCFHITQNTKWIFNYEQELAEYVPVPQGSGAGVLPIDDEQRKLLEESYNCRKTQLNNLIRTITRCVESEQYRSTESKIARELSRVERNTADHRAELDRLREKHGNRITEEVGIEERRVGDEEEQVRSEQSVTRAKEKDLEERYNSKRAELERDQTDTESSVRELYEKQSGDDDSIERRRREIIESTERIRLDIEAENARIREIIEQQSRIPEECNKSRSAVIKRFESYTTKENQEIERITDDISELPSRFRSEEEKLPDEFRAEEDKLEREFENLRSESAGTIALRNGKGNTELHARIRRLLETRELLNDIEQIQSNYKRNRQAWESFNSGAYEKWN